MQYKSPLFPTATNNLVLHHKLNNIKKKMFKKLIIETMLNNIVGRQRTGPEEFII